jgi:thermostable 8-oxoguanine DNA glycosylase
MRLVASLRDSTNKALDDVSSERYKAYLEHFNAITPKSGREVFNRFIFSYLSVQLSWEKNVSLYKMLEDYEWANGPEGVVSVFREIGAGFHKTRPFAMDLFAKRYSHDYSLLLKSPTESWETYRTRLVASIPGLAHTKVSFAAEMIYPEQSRLICLDRHMLGNVYGVKRTKHGIQCTYRDYKRYERAWCRGCDKRGVAPAVARLAYWDKFKGYENSLFWSEVFV